MKFNLAEKMGNVRLTAGIGMTFLAGMCSAAITDVTTEVAARAASYLTATTTVTVDGAAEVALTLATDAVFAEVAATSNQTADAAGALAFALDHLCPGSTYYVRAVATEEGETAVTNDTSFVVPAGHTLLCYKPDSGKTSYPWDHAAKWFSSPESGLSVNYPPSLGDDVFLYSSKNDLLQGKPPMTVTNGVHAETRALTLVNANYGNIYRIGVTVEQGGTMTNAGTVTLGKAGAGWRGSGAVRIENGADWTALQNFLIAESSGTSSVVVAEGGTFTVGGELVVGNLFGRGIVTNAGTMNLTDLFVGNASARGELENAGVINVTRKMTIGRSFGTGSAYMHVATNGVVNKRYTDGKALLIGHQQNATLEVDGRIDLLDAGDRVELGTNYRDVTGRLVLNGGAVVSNATDVRIGNAFGARGEVLMRGTSTFAPGVDNPPNVYVGYAQGAAGELKMTDHAALLGPRRFRLGVNGFTTGVVELADHAVVSNIAERRVFVCAQTNTWASLTVADSARLCGSITNLAIGTQKGSWGELRLRGGTVSVEAPSSASCWQLFLGRNDAEGTHGRVCGWGAFKKWGVNELRLTSSGQFIADGEGEQRDLDLSVFRTAGNGGASNACGSNGWYAVNGGRLLYPRTQNCTAKSVSHPSIGDHPTRAADPQLVNALTFAMTTPPTAWYYNYVALYAPDRADIPALPTGRTDRVQGVLRIGSAQTLTLGSVDAPTDPLAFKGCGFTLRYDAAGLEVGSGAAPYRIRLYRHDGTAEGAWTRLAEKEHDSASPLIDCLSNRFDSSSVAWNWGWFVVVAHCPEKGLTILIR